MGDTTPNIARSDHLVICLRNVNNEGKATERLLEIVKTVKGTDKTGLVTAKQILEVLVKNALNTNNLAFQS